MCGSRLYESDGSAAVVVRGRAGRWLDSGQTVATVIARVARY
jgi:hypothetical protein